MNSDEKSPRSEIIRVRGIVQGVGFRPTVWQLAARIGISGTVRNDGDGVLIEATGSAAALDDFASAILREKPPLAEIHRLERTPFENAGFEAGFSIISSRGSDANTGVSPDAATCRACRDEIRNPSDRRYRYPFTNCTHCGPRLSIIRGIPYDREQTSMSAFRMCPRCQQEYDNPADRRFHAQPNACPDCGPKVWIERPTGERFTSGDAIQAAAEALKKGDIVAIKGIGGFHLAADATNNKAVQRLRKRKLRYDKAFALMAPDVETIKEYCHISETESTALQSPAAPIVILDRIETAATDGLSDALAPGQNTLGFMLPYSPLHHLLMNEFDTPVVLTSGNRSEEPQSTDNEDARERLEPIADLLLLHDRDIVNRVDDSVVREMADSIRPLRRARGLAPAPLQLPSGFEDIPPLLAMGGELKNTFCLAVSDRAIVSQHMGDLEDFSTWMDYRKNLDLYAELYQHQPVAVIVDRHPEYLSSKLGREIAAERNIELIEVQHHHAHIASCLAENGYPLDGEAVLGVALDGLGFGDDGSIWGAEFLRADYLGYERLGCLKPVAMPGGALAMHEPWRNTYAQLKASLERDHMHRRGNRIELLQFLQQKPLKTLDAMIEQNRNAPLASSAGRLFDAVAAAVGICRENASYEGQAAIELEALIKPEEYGSAEAYDFRIAKEGLMILDSAPIWKQVLDDLEQGASASLISARFHKGFARAIILIIKNLCARHCLKRVALSGGVLQNRTLLEEISTDIRPTELGLMLQQEFPANDGGISLGQAAIGAAQLIKR